MRKTGDRNFLSYPSINKIIKFAHQLLKSLLMYIYIKKGIIILTIGLLLFSCSSPSYVARTHQYEAKAISSTIPIDSSSWKIIQPYKQKLDGEMNQVIGQADHMIYRDSATHELVGWMAEVMLYEARKKYTDSIDFAIMGSGGVRIPILAKGDITLSKMYELMPFENEMVVLTVDGSVVKDLFNYVPTNYQDFNFTNTYLLYKNNKLEKAIIHKVAFDSTRIYRIVVSDYLSSGGDNMSFLLRAQKKEYLGIRIRDLLIDYVKSQTKEGKSINPHNSGSIIKK